MERIFIIALFLALFSSKAFSETVEEAWEAYKINPNKILSPGYVDADNVVKESGEIKDFEEFKRNWDEAMAFISKFATTELAWGSYKVRSFKWKSSNPFTNFFFLDKSTLEVLSWWRDFEIQNIQAQLGRHFSS